MSDSTKDYWDSVAEDFDTYYQGEKDALRRAIDKIFRKGMTERFTLTLDECKNVKGKRILDIGCGSGRVAVELARRGAYVTGIDLSMNMIGMAKSMAEKYDVADRCTFIADDFAGHMFGEKFDISIALGFFDYTKDASRYLRKMRSLTTEKCVMSFPSKFAFQVPLRLLWLKSRNCPVYFYTKNEIKRLLSALFPRFKIKNISALYFSVAFAQSVYQRFLNKRAATQ